MEDIPADFPAGNMLGIFLRKINNFPGENPDSLSPGPFSDPENLQFSQNIPKIFPAGKFTGISHNI
jgi:hypothetical protein